MKVGMMQPYFFPYLGYYSLIKHTDLFILSDTVQFMRHGWIERNRVLKQNEGWLYIQVPLLKAPTKTLIKDKVINNQQPWQQKILEQLKVYKKIAPYYYKVIQCVETILNDHYNTIVELNQRALEITCDYLHIQYDIQVFSKMGIEIESPNAPDEWSLNTCEAIGGVAQYWNPPGGQSFYSRDKYRAKNIELKFQIPQLEPYNQQREHFESGLSIIDVMMFSSVEEINQMLDHYQLV